MNALGDLMEPCAGRLVVLAAMAGPRPRRLEDDARNVPDGGPQDGRE